MPGYDTGRMSLLRALLPALVLTPLVASQDALLLRGGQPSPVRMHGATLADLLRKVAAGPDQREAVAGLRTAIPAGTTLVSLAWNGPRCVPTFDAPFTSLLDRPAELELALEQVVKTVVQNAPRATAVDVHVALADGRIVALTGLLDERAPPPPEPRRPTTQAANVQGALSGRTIVISPSHGYYWHSSLGWTTQRPLIDGLLEDIHNNEIVIRWLIPYLENLGARVISCRERTEGTRDAVLDDDAGAPAFTTVGGWAHSTYTGYNGGGYRYASTAPGATDTATWNVPVPADGVYPVYAWYRAGTNRAPDALYEIEHTGGTEQVRVDQTRDGSTWRHLGDFWFSAAEGAVVRLVADSSVAGRVVIADAIRLGGGMGSIARGGRTSGRPRWQEAARYWAQFAGAPGSVWNPISGGQDNDDDVTTRPRFAEWLGADAFVSLHTNAGGGSGTSSYIYNGGATAGSSTLQARIHDQIVADIRQHYDSTWIDRGKLQANFGEVRLLSTMPGVLLELAFHDQAGSRDHRALHDPHFRDIAARAISRGVLRYFAPSATFPPDAPGAFRVRQDGAGGLRLGWLPTPRATEYSIEQSSDGKGFEEVGRTAAATWSTGPLAPGTILAFRVRAWNPSGRSVPTEVLVAGTSHRAHAELLLVQGFDRLERTVKKPENTFDYLWRHGKAVRDANAFSLAFDATSNEAVTAGLIPLVAYRAVDWACGEESTRDETFSTAEQGLVTAYVQGGGRLLVSGAEIGWDLEARGSTADRQFHRTVLGAQYVADDAGTYSFGPVAGSVFDGLPWGAFDDGTHGTYDVDYPDVVAPPDARSRPAMAYAGGAGTAALERIAGNARVVYLGFPLETIVDDGLRARVMERALRFLLTPRALEAPATVAPGGSAVLSVLEPAHAGKGYLLLAALATEPTTTLPDGSVLPLAPDPLLVASLDPANPLFQGFQGTLDGGGRGSGAFVMPDIPALRGLELYFSGIVLDQLSPLRAASVLPWVRITVW